MNADAGIQAQGLTRFLVQQAMQVTHADLSDEARTLARQCVLDYLGVTIAGANEPLVLMLLDEMREQGGAAVAGIIGHHAALPPLSAALVNGAASHALDFDDVNMAMPGHPTVAILPALLALAGETEASGDDVIAAFVAGYELQCRIGRIVAPGHYDGLGFHATATIGSFGAAAACAHLLKLDAEQFAHALGIAGTQAAGLKSMFGTMCKPLHAGKAASNGLLAAKLARRGFTSRTDVLECPQGFCRTHSPDFAPERALETPEGGLYLRANLFKYHAACYLTHAPIECARALRLGHNLTPDHITRINLRVDQATDRVCNIARPRDGLEAKFSLRLTTAMALAGTDTGSLSSYSEATAAAPDLVALRDKVVPEFEYGWPHTRAQMDIELTDGTHLTAEHDSGIPAADVTEQGRRLEEKFLSLVAPLVGQPGARDIMARVSRFDGMRALTRSCQPAS